MSKSSQKSSSPNSSRLGPHKLNSNKELRILGIDDSHFEKGDDECLVIGVLYREGYVESVLSTRIRVDGDDATQKFAELANSSKSKPNALMLQGITFAGFNIVDVQELSRLTGLPVIAIMRKRPDFDAVRSALQNLPDSESRWEKVESAGELRKCGDIYFQAAGTEDAPAFISTTTVRGNMPEPVRLAHVIASGVTLGSVHGRA